MSAALVVCVLLCFVGVGLILAAYSTRALIVALRRGVIHHGGQSLSFSDSPSRFVGAVTHIALGMVAGLVLMGISLAPLIRR